MHDICACAGSAYLARKEKGACCDAPVRVLTNSILFKCSANRSAAQGGKGKKKYCYTIKNSKPCCKQCNIAKNTLSEDEFTTWIKRAFRTVSTRKEESGRRLQLGLIECGERDAA